MSREGECPKCESVNLDWEGTELTDEMKGYKFKCKNCGAKCIEWYELVYYDTEVIEE